MESITLKKEADIHANQLAKQIIQRAMEWFPLIRQFKEGKVQEQALKQRIVDDVLKMKEDIQTRLIVMGESSERIMKDHTDARIKQIQNDANKTAEKLKQYYESKLREQEQSIEKIANRYLELETLYIMPFLEKIMDTTTQSHIDQIENEEAEEYLEDQNDEGEEAITH